MVSRGAAGASARPAGSPSGSSPPAAAPGARSPGTSRTGPRISSRSPRTATCSLPSADSATVAVASGGIVHLWDRASEGELQRILAGGRTVALSPDGSRLAVIAMTAGNETKVALWDWRASRCVRELEGLEPTVLLF